MMWRTWRFSTAHISLSSIVWQTSKYREERSGEMRGTALTRDVTHDMCNKCGKFGHWARNCPSQIAPGARQNYLQPQQAKRRPSNFRQPQRNYGSSGLSGHTTSATGRVVFKLIPLPRASTLSSGVEEAPALPRATRT